MRPGNMAAWCIVPREVTLIVLALIRVSSHPQCLDFRPPFEVTEGLDFCRQYSAFSCCTRDEDARVAAEMRHIRSQMGDQDLRSCEDMLQEILCQRCSPFAAHLYDAETSFIQRGLPGLCRDYCGRVYRQCRQFIPILTDDATIWKALETEDQFCAAVALSDQDYCYPALLTNPVLNHEVVSGRTREEGCMCLEVLATGLRNPLLLRTPPDGSGRMMVGEQLGVVYIFYKNGTRLPLPYLNISSEVLTSSWRGDERGFLGMTFHPSYAKNGRIFVYYSIRKEGQQMIRISELKVMEEDPNRIDPWSERPLLEVQQPFWNHNGGELLFGSDGYLYIFLGDGGGTGDPNNNAQNKATLLGKVLRINVDVPSGSTEPYTIPADNPFINEVGSEPEIYAYGIRNTWRCDVDEGDPATGYGFGRILCGDVGQDDYEEINSIEKGGNYGWNGREGFQCFNDYTCGEIGPEVYPIYAYNHSLGKSITGGHVYRGCMNPALQAKYVFGDFASGRLFSLHEDIATGTWTNHELFICDRDLCSGHLTSQYEKSILSFGEDDDGEMYILSTSFASPTKPHGKIYKLVDPLRRGDPEQCRSHRRRHPSDSIRITTTLPPTTSQPASTQPPRTNPIFVAAGNHSPNARVLQASIVLLWPIMILLR